MEDSITWEEVSKKFRTEGHKLPVNAVRTHIPLMGFFNWKNGKWIRDER